MYNNANIAPGSGNVAVPKEETALECVLNRLAGVDSVLHAHVEKLERKLRTLVGDVAGPELKPEQPQLGSSPATAAPILMLLDRRIIDLNDLLDRLAHVTSKLERL